jgi:hypothetical protein
MQNNQTNSVSNETAGVENANNSVSNSIKASINDLKNAIADAKPSKNHQDNVRDISDEVIGEIISLIADSMELFNEFGNTFTTQERSRLVGIGIKNYGFIETAYSSARANMQFYPAYDNPHLYEEAMNDFNKKRELLSLLKQFQQVVSDSLLASGDVAYHYSVSYYNSLKAAVKQRVPGAETEYELLYQYFKKYPNAKAANPTVKQLERDVRSLIKGKRDGKIVIENERPTVVAGKHKVIDDTHSERIVEENIAEKIEE